MPKKNKSGKKKSGTAQKAPEETKQVVEPEPEPEPVKVEEAEDSAAQADGGAKKKKRKRKKKKSAAAQTEEPEPEVELSAKEKLERRKMMLQAQRGTKFTPEQIAAATTMPGDAEAEDDGPETEEQKREKARALQTVVSVAPQKPKEKKEESNYTYTQLPETKAAPEEPAAGGKRNKKKRNAKVPNVRPKLDADEEKKMNAMFGTLQDQDTVFIMKKDGTVENVDVEAGQSASDLKSTPTLVVKDCKNVTVNVNRRVVKALIQNCHNCTLVFNQSILTNTLECWRSENVTIETAKVLKTMQLDIINGCRVIYHKLSDFGSIIWNSVEGLELTFKDSPSHDMKTGFAEAKAEMPDSSEVDQFIIRHLDGAMKQERCVRLKNGFLSTEREAIEWDKKNTLAFDRYKASFLKEAGVAINRDPNEVVQKPNDPCACGSGKKYKKCCQGKKVVMGVAGDTVSYKK